MHNNDDTMIFTILVKTKYHALECPAHPSLTKRSGVSAGMHAMALTHHLLEIPVVGTPLLQHQYQIHHCQ